MHKTILLFLLSVPSFAVTCTLPAGTYVFGTSGASWSCGHAPITTADSAVLSPGVVISGMPTDWTVNTISAVGTTGSHISISGGNIIALAGNDLDYVDFNGTGNGSFPAITCQPFQPRVCSVKHSTFKSSGRIDYTSTFVEGGASVVISNNVFSTSTGTSNLEIATYQGNPKTTGTRTLSFNVFDRHVNLAGGALLQFDVLDNYMAQGYGPTALEYPGTFRRNFVRMDSTLNTSINSAWAGTIQDHYSMIDVSVLNAHDIFLMANAQFPTTTADRMIIDHSDSDLGEGDLISTSGPTTLPFEISRVIAIPNADGGSPGITVSKGGGRNTIDHLTHSTWFGDSASVAMFRWSENGAIRAGDAQAKGNIAWGLGGTIAVTKDIAAYLGGTVTLDACAAVDCNYNFKFGITATDAGCIGCTNQGNGYWGKFSATPGANDQTGNPGFVDYKRSAALWDTKYLAHTAPAWSGAGSYTVGDIVSNIVTGTYWGLPINYRRIAANTNGTACSGNPQPGVLGGSGSTAYKNCWEYASLFYIRQGVSAGTAITDSTIGCPAGCTYIEAVIRWTMAGYSPTNILAHNTAHDGTDMGAVAYSAPAAPLVITPSTPPVVSQNTIQSFAATGTGSITWSLAAGSAGSINAATGVYTAPATVRHNNVIRGCPAFPNDHIYNQRIDTLPVDAANSANWITALTSDVLTLGVQAPSGDNGFSLNVGNNSTPTQAMTWFYTPENNGPFLFLPAPYNQRESGGGANVSNQANIDRHQMTLNSDTCHLQEIYKPFNVGDGTSEGCPTCTGQGGLDADLLGYRLGHGVDAGGAVMMPLSPRYAEFKAGIIKHALRLIVGANRTWCNHHVWPAQSQACNNTTATNIIPYGARYRLKSTFNMSAFSATAKIILTALRDYGAIMSDAGSGGQMNLSLDNDTGFDIGVNKAVAEISAAGIGPSNFEFVDESSLQTADNTSGQVKLGGAVAPSQFATVIATDANGSASMPVILRGVTVDISALPLPAPRFYVQAGTTKQFTSLVRGTATQTVNWTLSPATGSVNGSGLYTAPATGTISTPTHVTLTATSTADAGAAAAVTLTLMPSGAIRIDAGKIDETTPGTVTAEGNWWNDTKQSGGGLCNYLPDNPWSQADPNVATYYSRNGYGYGDHWYQYTVPNGSWKVTLVFGACNDSGTNAPYAAGLYRGDVESNGITYLNNVDQTTVVANNATPGTAVFTSNVSNGELWFTTRAVAGAGASQGTNLDLLAFKMEPLGPINGSGTTISGATVMRNVRTQ